MKRMRLTIALFALASVIAVGAALPAAAAEAPAPPAPIVRTWEAMDGEPQPQGRIEPMVLWTVSGIAIGCLVFGTFYLLKRRVGGFPKEPKWVAPISIMESKDFADEGTFGDSPAEAHGHGH
jgi:hypothetical protein